MEAAKVKVSKNCYLDSAFIQKVTDDANALGVNFSTMLMLGYNGNHTLGGKSEEVKESFEERLKRLEDQVSGMYHDLNDIEKRMGF